METLLIVLIVGLILAGLVGFLIFFAFYRKQTFNYPKNIKKSYNPQPLKGKVSILGRTNYPLLNGAEFIYNNVYYSIYKRDDKTGILTFQNQNTLDDTETLTLTMREGDTLTWNIPIQENISSSLTYTVTKEDLNNNIYLTDDNIIPESSFGKLEVKTVRQKIGAMALLLGDNKLPKRITERCFCTPNFVNCTIDGGKQNGSNNFVCSGTKWAWSGQNWLTTIDDWNTTSIKTLREKNSDGFFEIDI